ncbi:MAG: FkbM family methyltransferase [Alphaproteobacteria bacterium]|nr:FkbM family methyltransferase [Alphaproteobacteria bacterium]
MADHHAEHARSSVFYKFLDPITKDHFSNLKDAFIGQRPVVLDGIGEITFPYQKLGSIDTLDMFGLDELIIFSFYMRNRNRYKKAIDIGANLGLHSLVLAQCGYSVVSYEPDPIHYQKLQDNLKLNGAEKSCIAHQAAISASAGRMEFTRVLGNTTGSHLSGAKANPYGDLERFDVDVFDIKNVLDDVTLAKIDAEGHEVVILNGIPMERWAHLDVMVEIGTPENAKALFENFQEGPVHIFSQKKGWARAHKLDDLPTSYREGSAFLTCKDTMPWSR